MLNESNQILPLYSQLHSYILLVAGYLPSLV